MHSNSELFPAEQSEIQIYAKQFSKMLDYDSKKMPFESESELETIGALMQEFTKEGRLGLASILKSKSKQEKRTRIEVSQETAYSFIYTLSFVIHNRERSQEEIAERLNMTTSTMVSYSRFALKSLRELLVGDLELFHYTDPFTTSPKIIDENLRRKLSLASLIYAKPQEDGRSFIQGIARNIIIDYIQQNTKNLADLSSETPLETLSLPPNLRTFAEQNRYTKIGELLWIKPYNIRTSRGQKNGLKENGIEVVKSELSYYSSLIKDNTM